MLDAILPDKRHRLLVFAVLMFSAVCAFAEDRVIVVNPVRISTQTLSTAFSIRASTAAPETPDWTNCTASGETVLLSSAGANTSYYINKVTIHNADSSNVTVSLLNGSGGTVIWKGELASEGGAVGISFGVRGWKLSANTQLVANLSGAGNVDINVTEFYKAP
jgi:hypothetical protein